MKRIALLACAFLLLGAAAVMQRGTYALLGGTPKIVSKFWAKHGAGLAVTLNVRQFRLDGRTPILKYDIDMQKFMHLIVIRDDFATFDHLHPAYSRQTGIFNAPFTKQAGHKYFVYADSEPSGIGQQAFRFTIESDGAQAALHPNLKPSSPEAKAGPYTVMLKTTSIAANAPQNLDLSVMSGADPATDLVPYLGAAAHVVLIDTGTLVYVHVHPALRGATPMPAMTANMHTMHMASTAGPLMQLSLPALPAGVYKAWVQFRSNKSPQPYVAAFTISAQ